MDAQATGIVGAIVALLSLPIMRSAWLWLARRIDAKKLEAANDRAAMHKELADLRLRVFELSTSNARLEVQVEALREDIAIYRQVEEQRDALREENHRLRVLLARHGIDPADGADGPLAPPRPAPPAPDDVAG